MTLVNGIPIGGIIVDIILFFIVAGNAAIGYKRGLARVLLGLLSSIIAIILVFVLYKPVTNFVINNTKTAETLGIICEENLRYLFEKNNVENTEQLQQNENMSSILNVFIGDEIENTIQETKDSLIKYLSVEISQKVISVIVFFALFAGIRLLLYILRSYIEMIADLPIIRVFNSSGGMIYGVIRGFFIIYIVFALISIAMPVINNTAIVTAIQNAPIGNKMFNNNIILNSIFNFL